MGAAGDHIQGVELCHSIPRVAIGDVKGVVIGVVIGGVILVLRGR